MKIKFSLKIYLIHIIFQLSKSLTPIWNFNKSVENLLNINESYTYTICEKNWSVNNIILTKTIKKKEKTIEEKNYVKINNEVDIPVNWENIESFYFFDEIGYICPSGKNHLTIYKNKNLSIVVNNLINTNDWDLKCYYQSKGHYLFLTYLNTYEKGHIYSYKIKGEIYKDHGENFNNGIFDFIWTHEPKADNKNEYYMMSIILNNKKINLVKIIFIIDNAGKINTNKIQEKDISDNLKYIKANFTNDSYLYFISYNESNYYSSHSNEKINVYTEIGSITFNSYNIIPFEIINNITIKSIDFINNTQYVYYIIESYETSIAQLITYYGIIDIKKNRVLFNTNEEIQQIKPYSSNSLLIITKDSAYKLCIFAKDNNNNCINECPQGQELILDTENSNHCGNQKENDCENYILKPNNICIPLCNNSIYIIENKSCYLCNDIFPNEKPYKIYNESSCINTKPENTFFLYEKIKILKYCNKSCKSCFGDKENECLSCNEGYKLENGKCIKKINCYKTCNECNGESTDEKEQNCTSCKDNKLLQEDKGNCIDTCLDGYYEKDKKCKNCYENCEKCNKGGNETLHNCISCKENKLFQEDNGNCIDNCLISYYEEDKKCKNCYKNCEKCNKGGNDIMNNCTSCKDNKLLQEDKGNCIDNCLDGYYEKDKKCINCYKNCEKCNKGGNETSHNCISCKENKLLQEDKGNCIDNCLDGYYKDDKKCKNCNSNCKTCNNNSTDCNSCFDNMFLINDTHKCLNECDISYYKNDSEKKCYKCNSNCKSCSKGSENNNNYCLSCNENSIYQYLVKSKKYGLNCVEKCPNFTILNETLNICFDEDDDIKEQVNVTFWKCVFVFLILFSIFIVFYVIYMCKPKKYYSIINDYNFREGELFAIQNENEQNSN